MRCFLPPLTKKGRELHKCLKRRYFSLRHFLRYTIKTINAYNHMYYDVEMWMYPTNILRSKHGYMYMITLRSLEHEGKHTHKTIDVKYLPTIVEEGVCYETMGVQCLGKYCVRSIAPMESTSGFYYNDLPSTIHVQILNLVQKKYNVDDIRRNIASEYRVILEIHVCNNPSPVFKRCILSAVASTSSQGVCEVR